MQNFVKLKEIIEKNMDATVMHCSYDYAFASDIVTLKFHSSTNVDRMFGQLTFAKASHNLGTIAVVAESFLKNFVR